ncbi:MAG: TetR family transcriptional regulator [Sorangiineae bacterium]|nr:TetR family transcriptional regulator [Polyangiaceae bacterium]MEB2322910.1 TetR family transcriptional regulator [Sorangiineae bacterium]
MGDAPPTASNAARGTPMRAPARGRYDRAASADERCHAQRERLLLATLTAFAAAPPAPTVTDVVRRAGVGRNTFYAHFADLDAALLAAAAIVTGDVELRVRRALGDIRTPLERLRELARAWLAALLRHPRVARALLMPRLVEGSRARSHLGESFRVLLTEVIEAARADAAVGARASAERVSAMSAAAEHVALDALDGVPHRSDELADLLVRAFR